ncbi:hypothetical protein KFK09_014784 [Dendrobium nobile]|uniref:Uncharacterized protein n=1 Tax=Dendrobium nobile TaxID=94219 RepID=A0A8T3B440_DENNO|nr:hypothetical protein KFK09_014784 [Dendrobium nobile]
MNATNAFTQRKKPTTLSTNWEVVKPQLQAMKNWQALIYVVSIACEWYVEECWSFLPHRFWLLELMWHDFLKKLFDCPYFHLLNHSRVRKRDRAWESLKNLKGSLGGASDTDLLRVYAVTLVSSNFSEPLPTVITLWFISFGILSSGKISARDSSDLSSEEPYAEFKTLAVLVPIFQYCIQRKPQAEPKPTPSPCLHRYPPQATILCLLGNLTRRIGLLCRLIRANPTATSLLQVAPNTFLLPIPLITLYCACQTISALASITTCPPFESSSYWLLYSRIKLFVSSLLCDSQQLKPRHTKILHGPLYTPAKPSYPSIVLHPEPLSSTRTLMTPCRSHHTCAIHKSLNIQIASTCLNTALVSYLKTPI